MADSVKQNYPIVVMAFNRPDYLREVLDSLLLQQGVDLAARQIALFLDGSVNAYSQKKYAEPADVEANIAVFRACFPNAEVKHSPVNLGVALNFDRAERWVFDELAAPAAIFLEDDMVLSPHYIRTIDRMLDVAMVDQRIGYVAAYGDWKLSLEKQRENPGQLIPLWQNWAFGVTRHQWLKNQNFMEQYLKMVRGVAYRDRPHAAIFDLYSSYGMARDQSSQDRAKLISCTLTGGVRINTRACLARYIGRVGLHSNEQSYVDSGFERTELFPNGNFEIEPLTDERYQKLMAMQTEHVAAPVPKSDGIAPVLFTDGHSGVKALRGGFYLPERWGVWSGSKESRVWLQLPPAPARPLKGCWVTANHYTKGEDEDVDVTVQGNGEPLGTIKLSRKQRRIFLALPDGLINADGSLDVLFISASIISPKEATGTSGDSRPLGLGLVKFEFE